jgi:hypothetical protein
MEEKIVHPGASPSSPQEAITSAETSVALGDLIAEAKRRLRARLLGQPIERALRALVGEPGDLTDDGITRRLVEEVERSIVERGRLKHEIFELRYAVLGGEDAPGHLMSIPHQQVLEWAAEDRRAAAERVDALNRLGRALDEIAGSPLPDQPATSGLTEYEWAVSHIRTLRRIAVRGLGCEHGRLSSVIYECPYCDRARRDQPFRCEECGAEAVVYAVSSDRHDFADSNPNDPQAPQQPRDDLK